MAAERLKESVRTRVAMDFTGAVGRIVEDPQEANEIAISEGYSWKRKLRPSRRLSGHAIATRLHALETGVHVTQPWYHSGMTREYATTLVNKYGTCNGVFLVRDSRSHPGCFVLTYKCGNKVAHAAIKPLMDPLTDRPVYSLDNGNTRFYDILQLVEFYQLNCNYLPTRLTHYVVQNGNPVVVPTAPPSANRVEQDQQSTSRNTSQGEENN